MKPISHDPFSALLMGCVSLALVSTSFAAGQSRAQFLNLSTANSATQAKNPGVAFFGGYIKAPGDPQSGAVVLQECTFGEAFSQWYPSDTYGSGVVAAALAALYPSATTRQGIEDSGAPFRYKWLMHGGEGTDVTAFDANRIAELFTQADRDAIDVQIEILKKAVAASPLDTSIRNTLLDIYYDLAVAEMQAVKPMLARLATFRLGLEVLPPDKFIIDEEIATYEEITAAILEAINQYTALLSDPFPGVDPSSLDDRVDFGEMPMGRYIFLREQPRRSSVPSKYANESGIQEVPQLDENGQIVTPGTLFDGYKDLNTLLQIVGQRQQHLASLARLRGTRKAPGDVALARQSLTQVAGADVTQLQLVKSWFPELFPSDLNALTQAERDDVAARLQQSGVLASLSAIELGRVDLASVAPLLNGNANILGYDPNFLLLVQDTGNPSNPKESYDSLKDLLVGTNQPLTVALEKLGTEVPRAGAKGAYLNFQEKVDEVGADIDNADELLADRFFAITGFEPDDDPGFDLDAPNPMPGSELAGIQATIAALDGQALLRQDLTAELDSQFKVGADGTASGAAQAAFDSAGEKAAAMRKAGQKYKDTTSSFYDEMVAMSAASAAAQAAYEATADTAAAAGGVGLDPVKIIGSASAATVTAAAGVVNTAMQTAAAVSIGRQEQAIDYAAIDFAVATEINDSALLINQAAQELSAIKREQVANHMDQLSDASARNQAAAQEAALLAELARIVIKRDSNVAAIRKKSYADPLHYHRAEFALIDADESFRTAQLWMFYTLQALNYKWHGQFAIAQGSKFYDTSTIFKCRNAAELNDLLSQMVVWDETRRVQTVNSPRLITRISLREHVLARNPNRHDPIDPSDPGVRGDDTTVLPAGTSQELLPTVEYFRKLLATKYLDADGNLTIPFSTAFSNQRVDRVDGNFFRGATYDVAGNITDPGFWREKIEYVKVNIVAADAPSVPVNLGGNLTYGGTMYFHTRVPPRSDRSIAGLQPGDARGELLVSPFRYWVSPDFSQNFVPVSEHTPSIAVAYNRSSAVIQGPDGIQDNLGPNFQVNAFAGRSIAASGWEFQIPRIHGNGFVVNVDQIEDIELIIAYKHSDRIKPPN
ncbi:hypothetical protein [Haloferula sp.]|uniref:hypothetical protein n=1 Tax=Haloferula sp. TaxID=2497595 RepID=UPI003C71A81C